MAYQALPLSWEYLNSAEFASSTSADCGRYKIVWGWQLKRGRKVIGSGYEDDGEECLRKAIELGWPKPLVAYRDRHYQWHTPLSEDAALLNAVQRGEVRVVINHNDGTNTLVDI